MIFCPGSPCPTTDRLRRVATYVTDHVHDMLLCGYGPLGDPRCARFNRFPVRGIPTPVYRHHPYWGWFPYPLNRAFGRAVGPSRGLCQIGLEPLSVPQHGPQHAPRQTRQGHNRDIEGPATLTQGERERSPMCQGDDHHAPSSLDGGEGCGERRPGTHRCCQHPHAENRLLDPSLGGLTRVAALEMIQHCPQPFWATPPSMECRRGSASSKAPSMNEACLEEPPVDYVPPGDSRQPHDLRRRDRCPRTIGGHTTSF